MAVLATVLALVLGLIELGSPALDYDEGYTVGVVRGSFAETWRRVTSFDMVQAPYYVAFYGWYRVAGEVEWALRLPSVACFVASVPVVYAAGRRLADARVGAVAAVLLACNGLALAWAQMARSYALTVLLVAVLTWLLARSVERPRSTAPAVAYGLLAVVATYAQFLVGLVVAAHLLSLLLLRPRPWRVLLVSGAIVAAGTSPAVVWVLTLRTDPLSWLWRPSVRYTAHMVADLAGGTPVHFFVFGGFAAAGAVVSAVMLRRRPGAVPSWGAAMLVLAVVLPLGTLIAMTYLAKPLLSPRYLVMLVPLFTLLAAFGIVSLADRWPRWSPVLAAVVVPLAAVGAWSHFSTNTSHEWRTATAMVEAAAGPDDAFVVYPATADNVIEYYQRRHPGDAPAPLTPQLDDPVPADTLWVVEQVWPRVDPESWTPMPDFFAWRDRNYRLVEERAVSQNLVLRRYQARR